MTLLSKQQQNIDFHRISLGSNLLYIYSFIYFMTQISNLKSAEDVFFKIAMLKKKKISNITRLDFYVIFLYHNCSSLNFSMYSHWRPFLCDKTFKNRKEINSKLSELSVTRISNYFNKKKTDYFHSFVDSCIGSNEFNPSVR